MKSIDRVERFRSKPLLSARRRLGLPLAAIVGALTFAGLAAGTSTFTTQARRPDVTSAGTGTLPFEARLDVVYPPTPCAGGTPSAVECYQRIGRGIIRGLGSVSESYDYAVDSAPAGCGTAMVRVLPGTARITVAGKGRIELSIDGTGCVSRMPPPLRAEAPFTITGGSGRYTGASGGGTYGDLSHGPPSWRGTDTWTGTLVVPGLDFDLTPPALSGARSRTIRIPRGRTRTRVPYSVNAQDDVDGNLPVTCSPRSGSWFKVGRTRVRCSAIDTSGNRSTATFVVTVKRTR
jgi:hypothetical protein